MSRINFVRAIRALMVPFLVLNLVFGVALTATGHVALISFGAALFMVGVMAFQTHIIRRMEKQEGTRGSLPVALLRVIAGRKRPDYAHIRELEIECGLAGSEPRMRKAARPGVTPLKLIRVEPKVTGRKPKRFDFSEDRAAMRALAETYLHECDSCGTLVHRRQRRCAPCEAKALNPPYRPENHPWTGRDD